MKIQEKNRDTLSDTVYSGEKRKKLLKELSTKDN